MALVNGKEYNLQEGTTVTQLLEQLNVTSERIAVEVNMKVIPKAQLSTTLLKSDDTIEIVAFVGGG